MNKNEKKIYKKYMRDLGDFHNKEVGELREEIEILKEENEKLKKENKELKLQFIAEEKNQDVLDIEYYTKQNKELQDQINTLSTKIARNISKELTKKELTND